MSAFRGFGDPGWLKLQYTMNPGDDSDWADLAEELGLESKPAPKRHFDPEPAGFAAQQTPGEPPPFPAVPWPQDPTAVAERVESSFAGELADLPDAVENHDEQDTRIDPILSAEEIAADDAESVEGDEGSGTGKKRRRRRRRRKGGPGEQTGEAGEAGSEFETDAENEVEPAPVEIRSTADAIRELVRNWSVPSWQDVVSGLYRPGGNDR